MTLMLAAMILAQDERDAAIARMESLRVTVAFHETPLDEAVDYLRDLSGLNIVVDPRARTEARVTLRLKNLSFKSTLKLMLGTLDLGATFRDGAIVVVPKDVLRRNTELRVYDVRDLLQKIQDFPGPTMELSRDPESPGPKINWLPEPVSPVGDDFLIEMVKANTGGGSWDADGASVQLANGLLIVTQTKGTHAEVARLLDGMRRVR